jgi:hypothetical protein
MSNDDKLIISADEAIGLLPDGDTIHNYANPASGLMLGVDYEREDAIRHFRNALSIEIGGDGCKAMMHPLVVWDSATHYTFFEADMNKVAAFEATRQST